MDMLKVKEGWWDELDEGSVIRGEFWEINGFIDENKIEKNAWSIMLLIFVIF